jgi:hypothetical protein
MAAYRSVYVTDVCDPEAPSEIIECPDDRAAIEISEYAIRQKRRPSRVRMSTPGARAGSWRGRRV